MSSFRRAVVACAVVFAWTAATKPILATTIIYSDDFSGSATTDLNGQAPDVRPGTETWAAESIWKANGTGGATGTGARSAANSFLPFVPAAGNVYRLSATLAQPTGASDGWAAVGFTASAGIGSSFWEAPNLASPWVIYRETGVVSTYFGPATAPNSRLDAGTFSGVQTLSLELDTTASPWKAEWFVGETSVRTYTFAANPSIAHVGFSKFQAAGNVSADFNNFSLQIVPEPSALALLPAGAGGLVMLWRRGRRPSR